MLEPGAERESEPVVAPVAIESTQAPATDINPADALAPLFGWAFLGLAGAYLLRVATESAAAPVIVGVAAGIGYAGWWMMLAARRAWKEPVASTVYSVTSALILAPLLWEATVRFQALSVSAASAVLVAFTVFGLAIGWRHRITGIGAVATLVGLITSAALFRQTHHAASWAASVFAIAAAVEFSACRDHWLGLRWASALMANMTVLILTVSVVKGGGTGQGMTVVSGRVALAAQAALLGIYLAATAYRTVIQRLRITGFEIGQAAAAFMLGIGGALALTEVATVASWVVGVFCVFSGLACYVISYAVIRREAQQNRNFYAYSTFAAVLMIVACRVLTPSSSVALPWAGLASALAFAGWATSRRTLRVHAVVSLVLAAVVSGALGAARDWLIQTDAPVWGFSTAYVTVLVSAAFCYIAVALRGRGGGDCYEGIVPAALMLWLMCGIPAMWLPAGPASAPVRTGILTLMAVGAARLGVAGGRRELTWAAYALVAATGVKLLGEDFRLGGSFGLFASLLLFGGTLIVLPRLLRGAPKVKAMGA